ncbi:MAG: TolC family protein [Saprospiraceae bacterium]
MMKFPFSLLFLFFIFDSTGQEILTIKQAIAIGLENNYSIQMIRNESEIAKNNNSRGNAGMLPELSFNSGLNYSGNNTKQEFVTGNEVDKKGAQSNNINAGISLNWTVFDGMKMFITRNKLKELENLSNLNVKIQIENTVAAIISAYYSIVKQKQLYLNNNSLLSIYEERSKIAKTKWEIGSAAKTDFLQAQLDLNEQKAFRLSLQTELKNLKLKLNIILARNPITDFDVIDSIEVNTAIALSTINIDAPKTNTTVSYYQTNISVAEYLINENQALRYPNLSFNATYNFNRTKNQAGFLLYNQNLGWSTGFNASWNLFNGNYVNRNIQNAKVSLKNAQIYLENTLVELKNNIQNAYNNYSTAIESMKLEVENAILAEENMNLMLGRFRAGSASSLELKEAQKTFEDVQTRLLQAKFDAKIAETELLKLNGELVK